ncbi:Os05g0552550 [Oryza sativa Japonica Group]|uniref:Os05g0552550 protein n=1 Tax=Oryza sativa subsp. japonica TaxID=39947 RepID=A0A0P0WQJ9_ORYSJ|nr:Os05g0552550 [Oryza sativa Japonica Group]
MDVVGEGVELERQVEVGEAVIVGDPVPVDPRVLLGDGHHVRGDLEHAVELDEDAVGRLGPRHGQAGTRLPPGVRDALQLHGLAVEDDGEAVGVVVPHGRPARADVEAVAAGELHGDRLHPGRVPLEARDVVADEVAVDVQVRVGEQAEVAVTAAVEVERVAVAADEPRVLAHRARQVAICNARDTTTQPLINRA